jgi:glutathione S-transferase
MARFELYANPRSAPSYKVALMFALSGAPFDFHLVEFSQSDMKGPAHTARNRFQQVPAVVDTADGRAVVQSPVILEFLAERIGRFAGADDGERLSIREWMFWSADRLSPPLWRSRANRLGFRPMTFETAAMYHAEGNAALDVLEKHYAAAPWLVGGRPTIADIDVYCPVAFAEIGGFDLAGRPALAAFKARFEALDGFAPQAALMPTRTTLAA